jgi:diguanylate cyclase (GGDEF)-like protein
LRDAVRQDDIVGRYGGDEFAVVLPRAKSADAEEVGERILRVLEGHGVAGRDGTLPLRVSLGVNTLRPDALPSPEASASSATPRSIASSRSSSLGRTTRSAKRSVAAACGWCAG